MQERYALEISEFISNNKIMAKVDSENNFDLELLDRIILMDLIYTNPS